MAADLDLGSEHFEAFFRAVHAHPGRPPAEGPTPFPWQQRLAERVIATGEWPTLLDLPTGSGKTAALDIAVFVQAVRHDAPRRTVFVVDRRVIVQQAAERARRLATRLADPHDDVLIAVAQRLRALAAPQGRGEEPLKWAELRGGIMRDESWAMRPDAPAIIVSTVDQVGSRLLFRGYGVSPSMRPVHAGLLGNDALFLLDEVHLSQPFTQTLRALATRHRPPASASLPNRWQVVQLSATPGQQADEDRFHLDAADIRSKVLGRRLASSKPVRTELVKVGARHTARSSAALISAVAREVNGLFDRPYVRSLLVVVNRVATAVAVARAVGESGIDTPLLTGRMRPFDRDDALGRIVDRLSTTERQRNGEEQRMVLVSTQAVEAGADFDLDGIVTECASLDALRQRFGRVDRDGVLSDARTPAPGVILATSAQVGEDADDDAVYGRALRATWDWLQGSDRDFGYGRMALPAAEELETLLATKPDAPVVLPAYLDAWVQTSPAPSTDPDVALWLHGIGVDQQPDVNLVWRADLSEELLDARDGEDAEAILPTSACPPCSGEAMAVPVSAVKAWLRVRHGAAADLPDVADVEGAPGGGGDGDDGPPAGSRMKPRPCLVWAGRDSRVIRNPADLRAGDTIVVPATYGGVSNRNWDPSAADPVTDLGLRAQAVQRRRAVLRLHPDLMKGLPDVPDPARIDEDDGDDRVAVAEWLDAAAAAPPEDADPYLLGVIKVLQRVGDRGRRVERVLALGGLRLVVAGTRPLPAPADSAGLDPETVDSEPDDSSLLGVPVPLDQHLRDVEGWARATAGACGLPPDVVNDLALAGRLHDLGKCDARFQRYLRGGGMLDAVEGPLAKSGMLPMDWQDRRWARRAAGYPQGERHELLSIALASAGGALLRSRAVDWDLVLHLIASHHGYARPFVPVAHDRSPILASHSIDGHHLQHSSDHRLARLDSGVPDRFWRLVRRYGWFGLAWLEATLRLADHRASAEEQARGGDADVHLAESEKEAS